MGKLEKKKQEETTNDVLKSSPSMSISLPVKTSRRETLAETEQRKRRVQQEIIDILVNEHIIFKPNTTIIVPESESTVEKLATLLMENQDITVRIEGHVAVPERKRGRPKK